jgi:Putative metal-binding motif
MNTARNSTLVGFVTLVMALCTLVAAWPAFAMTTKYCYPVAADADGDGYARAGTSSEPVDVSSSALNCPSTHVSASGDCDDNNPDVHPYNEEIAFNGVDDNCDGRVDEAKAEYSAAGNGNTTTGFAMKVLVKDSAILAITKGLVAEVEFSKLVGSRTSSNWIRLPMTPVTGLFLSHQPSTTLNVTGLEPSTVYKARVRFYRTTPTGVVQVGVASDWYYTTTAGVGAVEEARTSMLLRGFKELDESNRGRVGYRGSVQSDGKRYGASGNEKWCSEFYAWVTKPYVDYGSTIIGLPTAVSGVITFFEIKDSYYSSAVLPLSGRSPIAQRGDYMPVNDKNHSTMLLGIEAATSTVWTLDGNHGNRVGIDNRPIMGALDSPDGLGHIDTPTLK